MHMEKNKAPKETFYDGYVVNCILDAAYQICKNKTMGTCETWISGEEEQE